MWGARRLLRTYGKTEKNESEFSLPYWLALVPTMYLLDATTQNSALTRRRIFATMTQNLAKSLVTYFQNETQTK